MCAPKINMILSACTYYMKKSFSPSSDAPQGSNQGPLFLYVTLMAATFARECKYSLRLVLPL